MRRGAASVAAAAFAVGCAIFAYRLLVGRPTGRPILPGGPGAPHAPGSIGPDEFLPLLRANPDDADARDAALEWYGHAHRDYGKLREHTLQLIARHPGDAHIFSDNQGAFYVVPDYRREAIEALQRQIAAGHKSAGAYTNLAIICRDGALPAPAEGPARRALATYLELPPGTALPSSIDGKLADLAVQSFHDAYTAARAAGGQEAAHAGFHATQEVDLLYRLGRAREALPFCAQVLPTLGHEERADFLVSYGRCLRAAGRIEEAKRVLGQVRAVDAEGDKGGPAHATSAAATELGLIALEQGNLPEARRQLLSAAQVQTCPHNTTQGLPLALADKLLAAGQRDVVVLYCDEALRKFTPGNGTVEELLGRARKG